MTAQGDVRLGEIERLRVVLQHVAEAPARVQAWLRAHGVAFDDLDERWQRVGFSLYNEIVEMSAKAKDVLDEDERLILKGGDRGWPTRESERERLVAEVGECCRGADPLCAAGCLVEAALRQRIVGMVEEGGEEMA